MPKNWKNCKNRQNFKKWFQDIYIYIRVRFLFAEMLTAQKADKYNKNGCFDVPVLPVNFSETV